MDETVVKLARYYLDADRLEAGDTALPLTYDELKQLADDVQDLAQVIDNAADGWFARQKQLKAARRAFKDYEMSLPQKVELQAFGYAENVVMVKGSIPLILDKKSTKK